MLGISTLNEEGLIHSSTSGTLFWMPRRHEDVGHRLGGLCGMQGCGLDPMSPSALCTLCILAVWGCLGKGFVLWEGLVLFGRILFWGFLHARKMEVAGAALYDYLYIYNDIMK